MTRGTVRTTGYRVGRVIRSTNRYYDWIQSTPAGGPAIIADETSARASGHSPESPDRPQSGSKIAAAKTAPTDSAFVLPDAAKDESSPVRARTLIPSGLSGLSGLYQDAEAQLAIANFGLSRDYPDWLPAGAGVCPVCDRVAWLRAGPTTTPCDACALLLADPAEVTLRGELP